MRKADLELIRPLWLSTSFVEEENCDQSLKIWLMEGNYYVNHAPPNLSLFCQTENDIKKSVSLDAFRFVTHSAQSVYELEKTSAYSQLTSWRIIQTYYAAYFSAHAILRFFGRSFSHLENGHVRFLAQRCYSEAGYAPVLPSSYYLVSFLPNDKSVSFLRCTESHKDLWKCFYTLLQDVSSGLLSARASEQRRQSLSQDFAKLADALSFRGKFPAGNWLSVVRNEVNYKSSYGSWFPFSKSIPPFERLMRNIGDWRNCSKEFEDPNFVKNDLERFFVTAFLVVDMGLSIGLDYQEMANKAGRRSADLSRLLKLSAAA